jgi:phosphotriesterase-related protein
VDETHAYQLYFDKNYDEERLGDLYSKLLPVFISLYESGCRTVAEASPPIGGQNLKLMQKLSVASKINIIPNTGWLFPRCVYLVHDEKDLAKRWIDDFKGGLDTVEGINIRPGHIKILLDTGSLTGVDCKMVNAAAIASKETGMPIHCHMIESEKAEKVMDLLAKEGFDFSKFLWAHASLEGNMDVIDKAVSMGAWIGFDLIKKGEYKKNLDILSEALGRGYKGRILLSQDYDFYEEVTKHGSNHHCACFFTDFIPYCEDNGISRETIMEIVTSNAGRFFDI